MNDDKVLNLVSGLTKLDDTLDDDAGKLISNFGNFATQLASGIKTFEADTQKDQTKDTKVSANATVKKTLPSEKAFIGLLQSFVKSMNDQDSRTKFIKAVKNLKQTG